MTDVHSGPTLLNRRTRDFPLRWRTSMLSGIFAPGIISRHTLGAVYASKSGMTDRRALKRYVVMFPPRFSSLAQALRTGCDRSGRKCHRVQEVRDAILVPRVGRDPGQGFDRLNESWTGGVR